MKKLFATFLLFLYSFVLSGMIVQIHFCHNKVESVQVNNLSKECCCGPTDSHHPSQNTTVIDKESCCSNSTFNIVQAIDDQFNSTLLSTWEQSSWAIIPNNPLKVDYPFIQQAFNSEDPALLYLANAPPHHNPQYIPYYLLLNARITYA